MARRGVTRQETSVALSNDQMENFKAAFKIYSDGQEILTTDQLNKVLTRVGVRGNADKMLTEAQQGGDRDGIDFLTFQTMMSRKMATGDSRNEVEKAFKTFDWKGCGKIPLKDFETQLTTLGEPLSRAEVQEVMKICAGEDNMFHWKNLLEALYGWQ
eukprot:TRINITY_DN4447_c0_g1_i3.p1 TRINITY_DN4447_c0_g1~~TRINITY_DN4447_c0_g1_i3.p1  ORF type:complete len:157 (-),score=32.63 TRINITY_DN4447_c0_g1_i3:119-589(-)